MESAISETIQTTFISRAFPSSWALTHAQAHSICLVSTPDKQMPWQEVKNRKREIFGSRHCKHEQRNTEIVILLEYGEAYDMTIPSESSANPLSTTKHRQQNEAQVWQKCLFCSLNVFWLHLFCNAEWAVFFELLIH